MEVTILNTGQGHALQNMQIDESLLQGLDSNQLPVLHLYSWAMPSITYGYFAKIENLLDLDQIKKHKVELAKRVTGGGVTFHFCDYAFSFLMPSNHPCFFDNTLKNYRFVNQFVLKAVSQLITNKGELGYLEECSNECDKDQRFNFCMAKPTIYDVLYQQKKIGGAAQRKTAKGYLHHGTISVALPDRQYLKDLLKSKEDVFEAIYQNTHYFVDNHQNTQKLIQAKEKIEEALIQAIIDL